MKFRLSSITLLVLPLSLLCVYSGLSESNSGKIPLSEIWVKPVLEMSYWKTRGEGILCAAISHEDKSGPLSFTFGKLIFYRQTGNAFTKIYEFEPGLEFVGLHQLYNGDLMTLWRGVTALYVSVFSLLEKEIKLVLEEGGAKATPEIADIDNDGLPEILISTGVKIRPESSIIEPETTSIYKFDGKSYVLVKRVPWERRFDHLKPKESGEK